MRWPKPSLYEHFSEDFDKGTFVSDCGWKSGNVKGDNGWIMATCKCAGSKDGKKRKFGLNVWEKKEVKTCRENVYC